MARQPRVDLKDHTYHVINRANARVTIFFDQKDYELFEITLADAQKKHGVKIYAYCIMPNHFHLVLSPTEDGNVGKFMYYFSMTFTQRWHRVHRSIGTGHLFQGRYKSFIVQDNKYLLQLLLYVERNPLRAKLVNRAEDWRWSSLWLRTNKSKHILSQWPIDVPSNYLDVVNDDTSKEVLETIRLSITKNVPLGLDEWRNDMIEKYNLHSTIRSGGRPKNRS